HEPEFLGEVQAGMRLALRRVGHTLRGAVEVEDRAAEGPLDHPALERVQGLRRREDRREADRVTDAKRRLAQGVEGRWIAFEEPELAAADLPEVGLEPLRVQVVRGEPDLPLREVDAPERR